MSRMGNCERSLCKICKENRTENLHEAVEALNEKLNIPKCFKEIIPDEEKYGKTGWGWLRLQKLMDASNKSGYSGN